MDGPKTFLGGYMCIHNAKTLAKLMGLSLSF